MEKENKKEKPVTQREREISLADKWCQDHLGYIPTAEQWLAVNQEEPGLVKLFLHVFSNTFFIRSSKKEIYHYEREPNVIDKSKEYFSSWYGRERDKEEDG